MRQQITLGEGVLDSRRFSFLGTQNDSLCLSGIWNERDARFSPCFLPWVATVPALVAVLTLLWQAIRLLIPFRPRWARPFVEEIVELHVLDELIPKRSWTTYNVLLTAVSCAGCVLQLTLTVRSWRAIDALASGASWIVGLSLIIVSRPRRAPLSILTIFVLQAVSQIIILIDSARALEEVDRDLQIAALAFCVLGISVILIMPLRDPHLPAKDISQPFSEPTSSLSSPEDNLTLLQFMTVSWMSPMIRIGSRRQLQDEDVWQLGHEFQHQRLHEKFRLLKGTVVQRLIRANIIDICILVFLGIVELILQYSLPLLLQKLLASMEDVTVPKRSTVVYAALSLSVRLLAAQSGVFSLWFGRRCYERSRGEMITMLYEKTLDRKISFIAEEKGQHSKNGDLNGHTVNLDGQKPPKSSFWSRVGQKFELLFKRKPAASVIKEPASMGKILNLMRNDVYEVAQRFWEIQSLIQKPLSVIFSVTLVVNLLGWPSMIAVFAIIIAQVINFGLARIMIHYEKKRRIATDNKLQVITQFVEAIRHLRWYGWQGSWLTQILSARQKELNLRVISAMWNLLIAYTNALALDLTPTIAFFAYTVIAGRNLRVDLAFPALQLFSMMTSSLRDLPQLIIVIINAWVAVGRIEDFMAEPDRQEMNTEALLGDKMALDHAAFAWPGSPAPVLKNINISFPLGLTVVYGEVASGKTALLQSLLGELDLLEGQLIRPHEPIGYCAQAPWLQSMSIRENIIFGAPYEDKRYKDVLDACALTPDLAEFKAGDLSFIGENGIGLSGGQRARVALARAIYSKATMLLLDDPLSALDQQTAELIVNKCFAGPLLNDRTVLLVTHRTDLVVSLARQMVHMERGCAYIVPHDPSTDSTLQRVFSIQSRDVPDDTQLEERKAAAVPDKFIEDEHRAHGGVQAKVYWEYIKAGKLVFWFIMIFFLVVYRTSAIGGVWFLKTWSEAYETESNQSRFLMLDVDLITPQRDFTDRLPAPNVNIKPWLLGFFLFGFAQSTSYAISQCMLVVIVYTAGKNMFIAIMEKVSGATFRFYDVTPVGRLMNRMTSDIGVIDGNICTQFSYVAWLGVSWISAIVVIASVTPTFLAFAAALAVAFLVIFRRFLPTSQSLRRLEMVSLTPLMSNFGALLDGLSTVRAFHAQKQFQDRVIRVVDTFQKMDHFYWSLQAWLMYRYDTLSAFSTFLITMLALGTNVSAGLTAMVLLAADKFVTTTHKLCKQYGQLQMEFVSVERIVELLHLEQESPGHIHPPAWWPSFSGDITFENVTIKYAPHLDPALAGISFTVKGGSKTAIIGRTGSGKSTLALALLATIVPEAGQILVDNIDLAEVDKQLLRTRVTFLAQDPVLFPGSMRQNLDPVDEHSDEDCELVLRRVCERQDWSLDQKVEAGGRNLSQGQRQLVGLARAVLRRSAIIILDEATASIDRDTAMQIQQVMHEEMKDSTVITIAHRLEAVRNADYCIVLGKGRILEQGPASAMLADHREDMVDNADDEE